MLFSSPFIVPSVVIASICMVVMCSETFIPKSRGTSHVLTAPACGSGLLDQSRMSVSQHVLHSGRDAFSPAEHAQFWIQFCIMLMLISTTHQMLFSSSSDLENLVFLQDCTGGVVTGLLGRISFGQNQLLTFARGRSICRDDRLTVKSCHELQPVCSVHVCYCLLVSCMPGGAVLPYHCNLPCQTFDIQFDQTNFEQICR